MSLQKQIMEKMKEAMKAKDTIALQALRAVKAAFLLENTSSNSQSALTKEQELKIIQKQVKQRKDSVAIYLQQGREDLAKSEEAELAVLTQFLPKALSEEEIASEVLATIKNLNASGMKDMGKVMGVVSKKLAGKAEGKVIADLVKKHLS